MAKSRNLLPEFFDDEVLGTQCSRDARLLYECTWVQADDYGNVRGASRYLRLKAFPYDDDIHDPDVEAMLRQLETTKPEPRILPYEVDGQRYYHLPKLYRRLQKRERTAVMENKAIRRCPAPPEDVISITYGDEDSIVLHDAARCCTMLHDAACSGSGSGSGDGSKNPLKPPSGGHADTPNGSKGRKARKLRPRSQEYHMQTKWTDDASGEAAIDRDLADPSKRPIALNLLRIAAKNGAAWAQRRLDQEDDR